MTLEEVEIGTSAINRRFFSEWAANEASVRTAFVVSPFVELASGTPIARQVIGLLLEAKRQSADVALVSDQCVPRDRDFRAAMAETPGLEGTLYLRPQLHAKAGLVTLRSGYQFGFVGSANLTARGLSHNHELVVGLVNNGEGSATCQLCCDLEAWIRETVSTSFPITINS